MRLICEECKSEFDVKPYRAKSARFCSQVCGGTWHARTRLNVGEKSYMNGNKLRVGLAPANAFDPGHSPWNKNLKGIHLSPKSEWKAGKVGEKHLPVGAERIKTDKSGARRAYVKIAEPSVWRERAILVWEAANGPVPKGFIVHHIDRNSLNDTPDNLTAMSRADHINEHRHEFPQNRGGRHAA